MRFKFRYKIEPYAATEGFGLEPAWKFIILEQDEKLKPKTGTYLVYQCTNGLEISISCSPEVNFSSNKIYLRGSSGPTATAHTFRASPEKLEKVKAALEEFCTLYCAVELTGNHRLTTIFANEFKKRQS